MNTQVWEDVKELLYEAMKLPPDQRSRFLDDACTSNHRLRAEVDSLLASVGEIHSAFMNAAPIHSASIGDSVVPADAGPYDPGMLIAGRYRLDSKLGQGGMGQVWLAEQISPVRRQVALKLIKAGMYDEHTVQRFEAERQSLAIMDHPVIARVYDAGTTGLGQPYFVMEYVRGLPISEYCDEKKLSVAQRLELFTRVCEGVQHAHQKAIIHRDLKPANLLVNEIDGIPTPHIIDFGLAKAISAPAATGGTLTQLGQFMGTPDYMSPEQAGARGSDIDTRTDVYSLGAVLYVLLTGSRLFETDRLERLPLDDLLRRVREEMPPRPSARVSNDRNVSAASASARQSQPMQLAKLLRGDLDLITMKALEKDRDLRYDSPAELASDVRRYLDHEPVVARPPCTSYQLRKFVRRHRIGVMAAAGVLLMLAAFIAIQAVELRRISRERDRANRERDRATRVSDFMAGMFKVSNPSQARGNSVTAREILDKASSDMNAGLAKDPEVQAEMMQVMATTYLNLGLYPRARDLAQHALDLRQKFLGPDDPKTLQSIAQLGFILDREGHFDDAAKFESQALDRERRILGPDDPLTIEATDQMGVILVDLGRFAEGEKAARIAADSYTRLLGPENSKTLMARNHLARTLWCQTRYPEADKEYRYLFEVDLRVLGPDHPQTLGTASSLASLFWVQHRPAEAERMYRQVLAGQRRVLGPEHRTTALTLSDLALAVKTQGRLAEAERLCREALAIRLKTLGPDHEETLSTQLDLADLLRHEGHVTQAERMQRKALADEIRVLGPEHPDTLGAQSGLAEVLIQETRYREAEKIARRAYEEQLRILGAAHSDTVDSLRILCRAMAHLRRYDEAVKMIRDAMDAEAASSKQGSRWEMWYALASVAAAADRAEDAIGFLHQAVDRGYSDGDGLMGEDDLKNLRNNPRFQQVVAQLTKRHVEG